MVDALVTMATNIDGKGYTQLGCYVIVNFQPNGVNKVLSTKLEGMKLPYAEWSHTNLSAFYLKSLLNRQ